MRCLLDTKYDIDIIIIDAGQETFIYMCRVLYMGLLLCIHVYVLSTIYGSSFIHTCEKYCTYMHIVYVQRGWGKKEI